MASEGRRFRFPPIHRLITSELLEVAAGRTKRLAVSMPPGHGKTTNISVGFPVWWLGRNPEDRLLQLSYNFDLACGFSEQARKLFDALAPSVFGVRLDPKRRAASDWRLKGHRGRLYAAGMGGSITGRRVEGIIIDDPIKGREMAESETIREKQWQGYQDDIVTRLEPGGWIVVLMTRWHEDDLLGRILNSAEADDWKYINLPALAEDDDPLGREPGEALWPDRYNREYLEERRIRRGTYGFSALYQGRPQPAGGGILKKQWFRYFNLEIDQHGGQFLMPQDGIAIGLDACYRYGTVDLAASLKQSADYFVIASWARHGSDPMHQKHFLMDVFRDRIGGAGYEGAIRAAVAKHKLTSVFVEAQGMQLAIVQQLKDAGLPVVALEKEGDKVACARAAEPVFERGQVYFLAGSPWLETLESELLSFPSGKYDDQVDAVVWGVAFIGGGFQPIVSARKIPDRRQTMSRLSDARRPRMD